MPHELTTCHTVSRACLKRTAPHLMAMMQPHNMPPYISCQPIHSLCRKLLNCVCLLQQMEEDWVKKFFQFTGFNLLLAFLCCMSLFLISPAASGSGIPDVKAYLNGVEHPIFKNFFTVKTFVAKVHSSCTAPTHCTTATICIHLSALRYLQWKAASWHIRF